MKPQSDLSVAAIDGKAFFTLYRRDLQQATRRALVAGGDEWTSEADWLPGEQDVRAVFKTWFAHVRLVKPPGQSMHGPVGMHRATLVSSVAAVCVDQRAIEGATNAVAAMPKRVDELLSAYRRTA